MGKKVQIPDFEIISVQQYADSSEFSSKYWRLKMIAGEKLEGIIKYAKVGRDWALVRLAE